MKKAIVFVAFLVLAASIFSSCKTHEKCPAYGKTPSKSAQKSV